MKELDLLKIINSTLTNSEFIGDDCAYLEDLNIFITQDTLVENIHFKLSTTTPYYLGRKSVAVNLSDIAASLSKPKYITISLSLPNKIDTDFVKEFYKGVNDIANEYGVKVAGGDITGSDALIISVAAIGQKDSKFISSRSNANKDDIIITTGKYGESALGLYALENDIQCVEEIIQAHINPTPRLKESQELKSAIKSNIAVMDTSDGLFDALYKIAEASKHNVEIDFQKVPVSDSAKEFCTNNNVEIFDAALFGGEDYELIACIPESTLNIIGKDMFKIIGKVKEKSNSPKISIKINNEHKVYDKEALETKTFNHFKEGNT